MAADDLSEDEEFVEEDLDVELDEEDLDEEVLDETVLAVDDEAFVAEDEVEADAVVEEPAAARARKKVEEEDDEDELDPDDVEADLDTILKDRIAAADDEDDEEEEAAPEPRAAGEAGEAVAPKKANEFVCTGCFLLVNPGQFGPPGHMTCPVGEEICPAIQQLEKPAPKRKK